MELTLSLQLKQIQTKIASQRPMFTVELEDDLGDKKIISVRVVPRDDVPGLGRVGDDDSGKPLIRVVRIVPPTLMPIVLQMIYYSHLGYDSDSTVTASLVYGNKVLKSHDFADLVMLLGAQQHALARVTPTDGNEDYYLDCLGQHSDGFKANRWVAQARAYAAMSGMGISHGDKLAKEFGGRGCLIARHILEEGPIYRGRAIEANMIEPALREQLPEVVGSLDQLTHELRTIGDDSVVLIEENVPLIRTICAFVDVVDSKKKPVDFVADGEHHPRGTDKVRFRKGASRLIHSVLSHLRVDLTQEKDAVQHVLGVARRAYGELTDGTSYRGMLELSTTSSGKQKDTQLIIREMENLGEMTQQARRAVVGNVPKRAFNPTPLSRRRRSSR